MKTEIIEKILNRTYKANHLKRRNSYDDLNFAISRLKDLEKFKEIIPLAKNISELIVLAMCLLKIEQGWGKGFVSYDESHTIRIRKAITSLKNRGILTSKKVGHCCFIQELTIKK